MTDPVTVAKLERALGSLRRRDREVFLAHRLDGLTYQQIADRFDLTDREVEHAMARAIYHIVRAQRRPERRWRFWPF